MYELGERAPLHPYLIFVTDARDGDGDGVSGRCNFYQIDFEKMYISRFLGELLVVFLWLIFIVLSCEVFDPRNL